MEMPENEMLDILQGCKHEIEMLERRVAHLLPKADAYEALCVVLNLLPRPPQGYAESMKWLLDKKIEEMVTNSAPAPGPDA